MKVHITFEFLWHIGSFDLKNMCIIVWKLKLKNYIFYIVERTAKLAYVDSYVKPPRDVRRQQLKYGTAGPSSGERAKKFAHLMDPIAIGRKEREERGLQIIPFSVFICQSMNKINLFNLIKLRSPVKCDYKEKINYRYLFFLLSLIKH